jgi:predicted acylesterase/phospholipase RssA
MPKREQPPFERIALLLQGGGALGAYQGGVYQALAEADLHPDCVSGVSIGAVNAALICGNPPGQRVAALRAFWEKITSPPFGYPFVTSMLGSMELGGDALHRLLNQASSARGRFFRFWRLRAPMGRGVSTTRARSRPRWRRSWTSTVSTREAFGSASEL